jgi:hypothetical protein
MMMIVEKSVEFELAGTTKVSGENLTQCLRIPLRLLGNGLVTKQRLCKGTIVRVVSYAARVVSNKRTSCNSLIIQAAHSSSG